MTRLYACPGSGNCFKPWLALNQLGLPFELSMVDVLAGEQKSDWFMKINPDGVVPYLVTDGGRGLGESNAMLWYLAENTYLMPADNHERASALQWMFFEQSRLEPYISPARFFTTILPAEREKRATDIAAWQAAAKPGLARLDTHLAGSEFMLGSGYSVADIALFGYVHVTEEAGIPLADYPSVSRWLADVTGTDNFRPLADLGSASDRAA
ncbi:glutathione S-transferase family protein [uncultured Roseobacter sp.]|uniref:glutathione S-transferase family protein n=1 Tax=uncultured Roseobacter sp. TaxID=114847 RepID=UPI00261F1A31|nr:glutathione S-transferase family protein [uncultured Roseobacter sp.]